MKLNRPTGTVCPATIRLGKHKVWTCTQDYMITLYGSQSFKNLFSMHADDFYRIDNLL